MNELTKGVQVPLAELIALRRYARKTAYNAEGRAVRSGNHLSKLRGRGMDFSEVRNYQAGDEIRHMEWRVTARTGKPHVKLYQEERERPVVILADFNPSMYFGTKIAFKSVIAARLAAMIAWTVVKQGDRIGALLYALEQHREFYPKSRDAGVLPILSALEQYTAMFDSWNKNSHAFVLSDALIRLRRVVKPGSIIVLISDFYSQDNDFEKHLTRLCEHNDVLAYQVSDPLEIMPPKPALYAITDGTEELLLDTANHHVTQNYQQWCVNRQFNLQKMFKRLKVQHIQLTGGDDIPRLVYNTFPRRSHD